MRLLLALWLFGGVAQAASHPFGFDDLARLGRLGDFDVSKDGKWIVYAVGRADVDENKTTSALWLMPVDRSQPARRLTAGTKKDRGPRFSPDGKRVAFVSDRDGTPEVYLLDLAGGEPQKLTSAADGKPRCLSCDNKAWDGSARYSPDGRMIAWRTQKRPGFESDKFDLVVYD